MTAHTTAAMTDELSKARATEESLRERVAELEDVLRRNGITVPAQRRTR